MQRNVSLTLDWGEKEEKEDKADKLESEWINSLIVRITGMKTTTSSCLLVKQLKWQLVADGGSCAGSF